jgi:hypothetical protein
MAVYGGTALTCDQNSVRRTHFGQQPPEMLEKAHLHETFFGLKGVRERPVSVATEFMESDWDDDEILSDVEDGENSPRVSVNSVSREPRSGLVPPSAPHANTSSVWPAEHNHTLFVR